MRNNTATADSLIDNRLLLKTLFLLGFVGGIFIAFPHLADEAFQDEAYSLLYFMADGFWYPFTDYHMPNNHILFSALLSGWRHWGESVPYLRCLPYLFFILTMPLLAFTSKRLAGAAAGVMALLFFAGSTVTESFVLQLRGYGPSWLPVVILLLSLPRFVHSGKWQWGLLYSLAAAASVAILPTNLFIVVVFIAWAALLLLRPENSSSLQQRFFRFVIIALGPLYGLAAYFKVWQQLLLHANYQFSSWGRLEILQHWLWATLADYLWALPIMAIGLFNLVRTARLAADDPGKRAGSTLMLLAAILVIIPAWVMLAPKPPFPRNLVPLLPVWYFVCGHLFVSGIELIFRSRRRLGELVFGLAAPGLFLYAAMVGPCNGSAPESDYPIDLCYQYHQLEFHPTLAFEALAQLTGNNPVTVVTDYHGIYSLGFIAPNFREVQFHLAHTSTWKEIMTSTGVSYPPLVLTHGREQLLGMMAELGLSSNRYAEIANTGFFKIYGIPKQPGVPMEMDSGSTVKQ